MIVAGIDIGTLTCRLLIAEITLSGVLREIDSDRRILRLGECVDRDRQLKSEAMDRVVRTFREWSVTIASQPVDATVAVATSAVREAKNRQEFLAMVKQETGFEIEVLSGEEEARRTLMGLEFGLPAHIDSILGLDIGGGSTEFIRSVKGKPPVMESLDIGVVRLTERYLHSDPPQEIEIKEAEQYILAELQVMKQKFGDVSAVTLVGTAGTVTTLAAMAQSLTVYEHARIHNYCLTFEKICELENQLRSRTCAARAELPGLESNRASVIIAGTIILRTVMESLEFKKCLVSDYGLREGIIVNLAKNNFDC